ncbi:MAG: hypothetical protein ABIL45_03500 [candidate division WOR-3 bacterium]
MKINIEKISDKLYKIYIEKNNKKIILTFAEKTLIDMINNNDFIILQDGFGNKINLSTFEFLNFLEYLKNYFQDKIF